MFDARELEAETGIYLAIFGAVLATLILPVPEELTLLGAGVLAATGKATLPGAFAAAWLGIVLGDLATYWLGRALLGRLLGTRLAQRVFPPAQQAWAARQVARHGWGAIVLGRFLIALRGPVYLAIGGSGYPPTRFTVLNSAVALVEVGLVVGMGYAFGTSRQSHRTLQAIDAGVLALCAASLLLPWMMRRWLRRDAA